MKYDGLIYTVGREYVYQTICDSLFIKSNVLYKHKLKSDLPYQINDVQTLSSYWVAALLKFY